MRPQKNHDCGWLANPLLAAARLTNDGLFCRRFVPIFSLSDYPLALHNSCARTTRSLRPVNERESLLKPLCIAVFVILGPVIANGQWRTQTFHSDANLRGLSVVNANIAWVSGTKGTFGRTTDGGQTWAVGTVPGASALDFRDVEAFGDSSAYLLSIGAGEKSRIYHSTDAEIGRASCRERV